MNPDGTLENVVTTVRSESIREKLEQFDTKGLDEETIKNMSTYDSHKLFK